MLKLYWNRLRRFSKMADHTELIAEFPTVEKMTTQERLKHAKKRRLQQLKVWSQREKDFTSKRHKTNFNIHKKLKNSDCRVHFDTSVMLLEAAARNDLDEVRRLLLLGVNPDSTNEDGLTALHQCCIDDSEEMMKLLFEFGANINAEDSEKWTPLHAAATCGHLNLAKYLINKGANLLAVNADGNMPYDICEDEKTLDYIESEMAKRGVTQQLIDETRASTENQMLKDLKEYFETDSNIDNRDEQGVTALHIASANGYVSVVEFLVENGANINVADDDGWQPIHAASCWGHPDIVEMLVLHGADLTAMTKNGETPYDICEDIELKERLQELKSEMETRKLSQQTTKLKRSQSQNTRSQSVRRTSLRDKSQISWKEAREEAKMRIEQQEKLLNVPDAQKDNQVTNKNNNKLDSAMTPAVHMDDITLIVPSENRTRIEESKQMLVSQTTNGDTDLSKEMKDSKSVKDGEGDRSTKTGTPLSEESDSGVKSTHDVKVDLSIHVTVNTGNPVIYNGGNGGSGTLPDLKKQRHRNRTSSIVSASEQISLDDNRINGLKVNQSGDRLVFHTPPSPSSNRPKFTGGSNEVIGSAEKRGCCKLM